MPQSIMAALLGATVIAVGWFVSSFLTTVRSIGEDRRRLRIKYLMKTYKTLEAASYQEGEPALVPLEKAIADMQLLGNRKQIELAIKIADDIDEKGGASTNDVLRELRQMLRKELGLKKTKQEIVHFRWRVPPKSNNS